MGLAPLGDGIYERLAAWRIGAVRIYKRLVKGYGTYQQLVTRGWDLQAASCTRDKIYK